MEFSGRTVATGSRCSGDQETRANIANVLAIPRWLPRTRDRHADGCCGDRRAGKKNKNI